MSTATVSLVINGKAAGRVSAETRERVELAVTELGYEVDRAARSLVTGRRQCVALVSSDMANPFISSVAAGVAAELGDEYQLLLAVSGAEKSLPDLRRVIGFGVDGVLLNLPMVDDLRELTGALPIVSLDDPGAPDDVARVSFATEHAAGELAEHLVGLGHRSIVYLDATRPWATFGDRRDDFLGAVARLAPRAAVSIERCDIDIEAGRALVAARWADWAVSGVTAVVAAADYIAYGALAAFAELGVDVPEYVSLASFDGLPYGAITNPPLTTVVLPAFELGGHGGRMMLDVVTPRAAAPVGSPPGASTVDGSAAPAAAIDARLVVRGSTGPASH